MKKYEQIWLNQINKLITDNLQNTNFQIADITASLEISRTKLYRDLLKLTGESPSRYIQSRRLERAKEILEIGVYPTVRETASKVGFKNTAYFSKLFLKKYKLSPKQILKK